MPHSKIKPGEAWKVRAGWTCVRALTDDGKERTVMAAVKPDITGKTPATLYQAGGKRSLILAVAGYVIPERSFANPGEIVLRFVPGRLVQRQQPKTKNI